MGFFGVKIKGLAAIKGRPIKPKHQKKDEDIEPKIDKNLYKNAMLK